MCKKDISLCDAVVGQKFVHEEIYTNEKPEDSQNDIRIRQTVFKIQKIY